MEDISEIKLGVVTLTWSIFTAPVTYCGTLMINIVCYCCRFSSVTSKWVQAVNCATYRAVIKRGHKMVKCKCESKRNIHTCDLTQQLAICHELFIREIVLKTTVDRERFTRLNVHGFRLIEVFMEIFLRQLGYKCSLINIIKERRLYSWINSHGTPKNHEKCKSLSQQKFLYLQYEELLIYMCILKFQYLL